MTDEELLQQSTSLPTMYFDGFGNYRKINGVLRCTGFIFGSGAQLNLAVSLVGAEMANRATRDALNEPPVKGLHMWGGTSLAH